MDIIYIYIYIYIYYLGDPVPSIKHNEQHKIKPEAKYNYLRD